MFTVNGSVFRPEPSYTCRMTSIASESIVIVTEASRVDLGELTCSFDMSSYPSEGIETFNFAISLNDGA